MTVADPARRGLHVARGAARRDSRRPRIFDPGLGASIHEANVLCRDQLGHAEERAVLSDARRNRLSLAGVQAS